MGANNNHGRANYEWGRMAEQLAAEYFIRLGYTVRERNWRPGPVGLEVDLITQIDSTIIFVEVKARSGEWQSAEDAVDDKKIMRLCGAADIYLSSIPEEVEYRFDIVTVTGNAVSHSLNHIENAFMPPLSTF